MCPFWRPKSGRGPLAAYDAKLSPGEDRLKAFRRVVDLCAALWGNLTTSADLSEVDSVMGEAEVEQEDENSFEMLMERKEALSTWLREQAMLDTEAEVTAAGKDTAKAAFAWLVGGRLAEACEAAQKGGEHRLALLLAQSRGSDCVRRMLIRQLEEWREVRAFLSFLLLLAFVVIYFSLIFTGRHGLADLARAPSNLRPALWPHDLAALLA